MKEFDLILVGGGAGRRASTKAVTKGKRVALVDYGPLGGTCLNRGCIPSKMLIYPADVIQEARRVSKLNISLKLENVDFSGLMQRVRESKQGRADAIANQVLADDRYTWYQETGRFIDDYILQVGNEEITAPTIVLANGARPMIPPIKGIEEVDYLTNRNLFELTKQPKSIVIIGGGYIAVEFGHFFEAIGTEVTILGRNPHLIKKEDPDVSDLLKAELSERMQILTNQEAVGISQKGNLKTILAKDRTSGDEQEISSESILVATGRVPNTDILQVEKSGIETDGRGFVKVDKNLRSNKDGIWALGDIKGGYMFRHVANEEARVVWKNIEKTESGGPDLIEMDYSAIPYAIFTSPQIATVGMTLTAAKKSGRKLMVGQTHYRDSDKGKALGEPEGFCRIIADAESKEVLGATIVGHYAPVLIQSIVNVMISHEKSYMPLMRAIYIHPAMPELVKSAIGSLRTI
jgi:dihydrolipoamide dehydrogenase